MMEDFSVQKKLQYYITYVKNLLVGFAEEFQTEKVHYRRILPIVERLFSQESNEFLNFFNAKKNTKPLQLLHLMHQQGEILNEGKGFYSLLPTRIIHFPNQNINVLMSELELIENKSYFGLAQLQLSTEKKYPSLELDDYAYRPLFSDIMVSLEMKLIPLTMDISENIQFVDGKQLKMKSMRNIMEDKWFIAIHETHFNTKEYYAARKRNKTIYGSKIDARNYSRIIFALCDVYKIEKKYKVKPLKKSLIEIQFFCKLPQEELSILNLISFPNYYMNPSKFITHECQLDNVKSIIERLNLKEIR